MLTFWFTVWFRAIPFSLVAMNDSRTIDTEPFITVKFVHHPSIFRIVPLHWAILQCGLNRYTACRNLNCTESVHRLFLGFPSFDVQHWWKKQSIWQSDITCVVNTLYKAFFHLWYHQFWTDLLGRTHALRTPRYYGLSLLRTYGHFIRSKRHNFIVFSLVIAFTEPPLLSINQNYLIFFS